MYDVLMKCTITVNREVEGSHPGYGSIFSQNNDTLYDFIYVFFFCQFLLAPSMQALPGIVMQGEKRSRRIYIYICHCYYSNPNVFTSTGCFFFYYALISFSPYFYTNKDIDMRSFVTCSRHRVTAGLYSEMVQKIQKEANFS